MKLTLALGLLVTGALAASLPAQGTTSPNAFAFDLLGELAGRKCAPAAKCGADVVVAPASVESALAMLAAGAGGATEAAMLRALGYDSVVAMNHAQAALAESLASLTGDDVSLAVARRAWAQGGLPILKSYETTLADFYAAPLGRVDFAADPERARRLVNAWAEAATEGRVPELLAPGAVASDTRLVVADATYLKAKWRVPFDPEETADGPFRPATRGETLTVPMMRQIARHLYVETDAFSVAELSYVDARLGFTIVLPAEGERAPWLAPGFAARLERALEDAEGRRLSLSMPRFALRFQAGLASELRALGMASAFDATADFSALSPVPGLALSDVIHEAYVAVDEAGTEAGAATAGIVFETGDEDPLPFAVDRTFLWAIRDRDTGKILFLGVVDDPGA